jgi:hypothetical protein
MAIILLVVLALIMVENGRIREERVCWRGFIV